VVVVVVDLQAGKTETQRMVMEEEQEVMQAHQAVVEIVLGMLVVLHQEQQMEVEAEEVVVLV
jgi:hypothetical protein